MNNFRLRGLLRSASQWLMGVAFCVQMAVSVAAPPPAPQAHWLFDQNHVHGTELDAAKGPDAHLLNHAAVTLEYGPGALALDGRQASVLITDKLNELALPQQQVTVEAWVLLQKVQEWGGIAGVIQDNGDFERGWLLGFRNDRFCFGLTSVKRERLTYLNAGHALLLNAWAHVVGTYDGKVQRVYVDGKLEAESTEQSGDILYPQTGVAVIGAYQDDNEFYPMQGMIREVLVYDRAMTVEEVGARYESTRGYFPQAVAGVRVFRPHFGPFVRWTGERAVSVEWETEEVVPTRLEWTVPGGAARRIEEAAASREHRVEIPDVDPKAACKFRVFSVDSQGREMPTRVYALEPWDRYLPPGASAGTSARRKTGGAQTTSRWAGVAGKAVARVGDGPGYALIVGLDGGDLIRALVADSEMQVVACDSDAARVERLRRELDREGVYGTRVSIHLLEGKTLPYGDFLANFIASESQLAGGTCPVPSAELHRCLRPSGGVLVAGVLNGTSASRACMDSWWVTAGAEGALEFVADQDQVGLGWFQRPGLSKAGDWSHQYGSADNTACSKDELVRGDMSVLWWGEPGPRPMPDRGPRNPASLSSAGRLYVQGDRIFFGQDAYNGAIDWVLQAPEVRRANLPRDCSNMAASPEGLYVATGPFAQALDPATGRFGKRFTVPQLAGGRAYDWGYIAVAEDMLIGSATREGSSYLGDDGEWYDSADAQDVSIVGSDSLAGYGRADGVQRWVYEGGVILNPTITLGDGVVYFIETRNPDAKLKQIARLGAEGFKDQALVALDLRSGRKLWDKSVDFSQAKRMLYLSYSAQTLLVVGSSERDYHLWGYDAPPPKGTPEPTTASGTVGGTKLWQQSFPMVKADHGGAIQHPVVVQGVVYAERRAFDLRKGVQTRDDIPERRGCGTMAASQYSLFFRHNFHSMWDPATSKKAEFQGIRGGCWLSMIPAGGLVLAPESSAGCSCTHSIQTSVAYLPRGASARPAP